MAFSFSKLLQSEKNPIVNTPTATVGIDIGSTSVKVVEIEETERALMLRTYGELQLGPYGGKDLGASVSLDREKKTEAIVDVIRESQVTVKHGARGIPLSYSFLTVIPVNFRDGEDPAAQVTVEAKKYVPLPLADVTLDWSELPPIKKSKTNVHEVLIAAIENKALGEYRDILTVIGMTGEPAEIEAFSIVRALWKKSDTTLAIIDMGAKVSKLYIARDGALERIHRVPVGGEQITKRAAELLGVSFEEAETMKRAYNKDDEHARDIYKAMTSVIEDPLREFSRLIAQYEARMGTPIGRIACAGGVATSPYFITYTKDLLAHDGVVLANAFSKVAYPAFMEDTLAEIAPVFTVSLGAALRQFQSDE